MAKDKVVKKSRIKSGSLHDEWLSGRNHKFKGGDVVESRHSSAIGVIQFGLSTIETYSIKWHIGPKPWDYLEGVVAGSAVIPSTKPNPLTYKWSQRVPGPSSDQIDALEAKFAVVAAKKAKSAKDVELHISILEEELNKKKKLDIDESKVDSIVDETLEEDTDPIVDGVAKKITTILEEE
jgi:hypothetical protein